MDHEHATMTQAAERYTLDELSSEERLEFEEHYFSCEECADAVRTCTLLAVNAKALAKEELSRPSGAGQMIEMQTRPGRAAWWQWLNGAPMAAAAAVVLSVLAFQNLVTIPRLEQRASAWTTPRALEPVLLRAQSRSALPVVHAKGEALSLNLELAADGPRPSYAVSVNKASGPTLAKFAVAPSRDGILQVIWPAASMAPGDYEILVRDVDDDSHKAIHYPFHFER